MSLLTIMRIKNCLELNMLHIWAFACAFLPITYWFDDQRLKPYLIKIFFAVSDFRY